MCVYCGKTFKRLTQSHSIKCELSHKSKNIANMEDDEDIPPPKKMYKMLLAMASEVSDLKQKLEEAHDFVRKRIKKINIVDTLNRPTTQPVYPMHEMIRVESADVEYLFQHSVFDTIDKIFSRCIHTSSALPIAAFIQKPHILYGYVYLKETNEHQQQQHYKWDILTHSQITFFLENIQFKLSKELLEWKKENTLVTDEDECRYDNTVSKLMAPDFKKESLIKKYRELFYERIKRDIMGQEYEFE
jgi:hypothetical protein